MTQKADFIECIVLDSMLPAQPESTQGQARPRVMVMTLEPKREIGPPKRCRRCGWLAECPIKFVAACPDSNGVNQFFDGYICEDCNTIGATNLTEFFSKFRS